MQLLHYLCSEQFKTEADPDKARRYLTAQAGSVAQRAAGAEVGELVLVAEKGAPWLVGAAPVAAEQRGV